MTQTDPMPGQVLNDRFRLVCQLGNGGMGSVWLADDKWLERSVALKALAPPRNGNTDLIERRQRVLYEARALARVRHPAIVPIHDLFFIADDPWIVMEYINGKSLDQVIREGTLDERSIARIGMHLVHGLAAVHRAGIVHRDVKPANILQAKDGNVFLVDFGIARIAGDASLTLQGIIGTLEYLPPERTRQGAKVGPPADVWALGVTFFKAIEGYSPFHRNSEQDWEAVMLAITQETPVLATHGPLADITLRMLVKDQAQRATIAEVHRVLQAILGESAQQPQSESLRSTPSTPRPPGTRTITADAPLSERANRRLHATQPSVRTSPKRKRTVGRNEVSDNILLVGPDTGAAMLLKMEVRSSARILAECPPKRCGQLLQGIAAVEPATAAKIFRMLLDATAGSAFAYLQSQTAASLLSAMPTWEAARILTSTDVRAAASTIMELAPAEAAILLTSMSDAKRAAEVLTHTTSATAIAIVLADRDFGRTVKAHLTEPLRTQIARALATRG